MIWKFLYGVVIAVFLNSFSNAQVKAPAPFGPVPSENRMRSQQMEYNAFVHFSLNTYTDQS